MNRDDVDRKVAGLIRAGELGRTARDIKDALGVNRSLRIRQAEVVSLSKTASTATIKIAGATQVAGVKYFTCLPCPGFSVWCVTDGEDIYITDSMGPAPSMKLSHTGTPTHTANGAEQNVDFQDPTDANGLPQNAGWDWWNVWSSGNSARLPIPAPGQYRLDGGCHFAANNVGRRYVLIKRVDNSNELGREDEHSLTATIVSMNTFAQVRISDATGIEYVLVGFQNSGGNLAYVANTGNTNYSPVFSWQWNGLP